MMEPTDPVRLLRHRHDVPRAGPDEPTERRALADALDASRSTVYDGVGQLQERDLVVSTDARVGPTLFGVVALARYDGMARTTASGDRLARLPSGAIEPRALVGAETVVPDERAVDRQLTRVGRTAPSSARDTEYVEEGRHAE